MNCICIVELKGNTHELLLNSTICLEEGTREVVRFCFQWALVPLWLFHYPLTLKSQTCRRPLSTTGMFKFSFIMHYIALPYRTLHHPPAYQSTMDGRVESQSSNSNSSSHQPSSTFGRGGHFSTNNPAEHEPLLRRRSTSPGKIPSTRAL